jgi:hypothetical protein
MPEGFASSGGIVLATPGGGGLREFEALFGVVGVGGDVAGPGRPPSPQRRSNCFASHPYRIMPVQPFIPVEPLIPGEL